MGSLGIICKHGFLKSCLLLLLLISGGTHIFFLNKLWLFGISNQIVLTSKLLKL